MESVYDMMPPPAWLKWPEIEQLLAAFSVSGAELRFVGGCVRDTLLERAIHDIDAATPLTPDAVMRVLDAAGIRALPTGLAHGTVTAVMGERQVEITTLRRDVTTDGRHAEVAFTADWKEDASRRDFTINALYMDANGQIFDYFGGVHDVSGRRVLFIGDPRRRIAEDYLRILRYFRFQAQLEMPTVHEAALAACKEGIPGIAHLSGERIQGEMKKLLGAKGLTQDILGLMRECGVLQAVMGGEIKGTLSELFDAERQFGISPDWRTRLAAIVAQSFPNISLDDLVHRWKMSRIDHQEIADKLETYALLSPYLTDHELNVLRHDKGDRALSSASLFALPLNLSESGSLARRINKIVETARSEFPVRGKDLLELGVKPGVHIGEILKMLEQRWKDSEFSLSREELLASLSLPPQD